MRSGARYVGVYGGRAGGKSRSIATHLVLEHVADPDVSTVCLREVQSSLNDSSKRLIEETISDLGVGSSFASTLTQIRSVGGRGQFVFRGLRSSTAEALKGLSGYRYAWIDEAHVVSQHSWELLDPTLRTAGAQIWASWNPRSPRDHVDRLFRQCPPRSAVSVAVSWRDCVRWLPPEYVAHIRAEYERDPVAAAHVWDGGYRTGSGTILGSALARADQEGRIADDVQWDPSGAPLDLSGDLGYRDASAWWVWQRCPGGYRVLGYDAGVGLDVDGWAPRLESLISRVTGGAPLSRVLGRIWLPHDARARSFVSAHTVFERLSLAFAGRVGVVPQSRKLDQIEAARAVLAQCRMARTACADGLEGLWEWQFTETDSGLSLSPRHDWASHPADAFCYGAQALRPEQIKVATVPRFAIEAAAGGGSRTATLDELWADHDRRGGVT